MRSITHTQNPLDFKLAIKSGMEIFSKNELGKQKALNREKYWKKVLQSREFGYNAN